MITILIKSLNDEQTYTNSMAIINVTTKHKVAEIEVEDDEYFASNSEYLVTYNKLDYSLKIFKIINGQVINN